MRFNISLDDELASDVDDFCKAYHYDRSSLIAEGLRKILYFYDNITRNHKNPKEEVEKTLGKLEKSEIVRWCETHYEKGKAYPCKLITWEDEDGNTVIDKKYACPTCLAKYEGMGRGKVTYL